MDLNVRVEKSLPNVVPGAISFETGASPELAAEHPFVYEHHGLGYTAKSQGALPAFFEDLILGRPLPNTFATRGVGGVDTLLAIALFLHRDLAIHPDMPEWVYTIDFIHRVGFPALAHISDDKAKFLSALKDYSCVTLPPKAMSGRVITAVGWLCDAVRNRAMPTLGASESPPTRILDQGTGGFCVAETDGSPWDAWVALYRLGFLRGLVVHPGECRHVLVGKKSQLVEMSLEVACAALNQLETSEDAQWTVTSDRVWLEHPKTTLTLTQILDVVTRV